MRPAPLFERIPVLPLRDTVLFPHVMMPLLVGRPGSLAAVAEASIGAALQSEPAELLLVAQKDPEVPEPAARDLHRVGTLARIAQRTSLPNGTVRILVEGVRRVRVSRFVAGGDLLKASVEAFDLIEDSDDPAAEVEARSRRLAALFEEYVALSRKLPAELVPLVTESGSLAQRAFGVAAHLQLPNSSRQRLLEVESLPALLHELSDALAGELDLLGLERKIEQSVRGSLYRNQREFYLQEQLKAIHRELDGEGAEGDEVDDLEHRANELGLPDAVQARVRRELRRLRRIPSASPEHAVARNFVDWVLALPWGARTDDPVDMRRAREVLNEDHHGLEEVKERILDHVAVLGLVGRADGATLCLVGPPGVGKTSLGRSIARALGRNFVRMSLGGVRDEAEIRGHRRTYVGAMPGRIVQAMRRAEVMNPVILLDEIDKLGQDWRGDPASALLEVLDPEQNRTFSDHFLEVDYDLSQVLFVTTANSMSSIPEALRDRMEIIRLPGYVEPEKLAIGGSYLVPRQLERNGMDPSRVTFGDGVLEAILRGWTREAGVRDLERRIARVARKLARRVLEDGDSASLAVNVDDLPGMLGPRPYDPDDTTLEDRVGVAAGLAYTTVGGEILEIEVTDVPGRGRLQLTGTLGNVMKESANAALSYARGRADQLGLLPNFHRLRDLHLHIPAGATPKDGPSAGIAICSAIISALTGRPVRGDVAMTGELTLRGRVLPVGGLREKLVAAHRHGIRQVALPQGNARDLETLPPEVREGVEFHLVRTMDEVVDLVLLDRTPGWDRGVSAPDGAGRVVEEVPAAAEPPE